MNAQDLIRIAENMEQKISGTQGVSRLAFEPEFTRILDRMRTAGVPVPQRLRRLGDSLHDEALEEYFDNVPV